MSWLKETIELSNPTYKKKATAEAKIKIDGAAINMKARTRHLKNHIYARRWQDYKVCMMRHFIFYRKRNMQSKTFTKRWLND